MAEWRLATGSVTHFHSQGDVSVAGMTGGDGYLGQGSSDHRSDNEQSYLPGRQCGRDGRKEIILSTEQNKMKREEFYKSFYADL